jgi:hypothetical protein
VCLIFFCLQLELTKQFLCELFRDLASSARLCIFLVVEDAPGPWHALAGQPNERRAMTKHEAWAALETSWAHPREFFCGGSTPLLSSLVQLVNRGFVQLMCLTDGNETEIKTAAEFDELQLFGTPMKTIVGVPPP